MQLFYTINSWAGQNAFLDGAMRGFYVAAIPLLATILAALLIFRPHRLVANDAKIARITVATIFAIALCVFLPLVVNWFSSTVLETPILSSRPYVTHWVNALVVEPNDNSFPSPETAIVGALFVAIWAVAPALAWSSFFYALLFCLARVFCGSNYIEDVLVGCLTGIALSFFTLSICRVALRRVRRFPWYRVLDIVFSRLKHQAFFAVFLLLSSAVSFWTCGLYFSPSHFNTRIATFWSERTGALLAGTFHRKANDATKRADNSKTTSDVPREGEGASSSGSGDSLIVAPIKEIPRPGKVSLGGNLPVQAKQLLTLLTQARLPHSLVSVAVASLRGDQHRDNINEEHFAFVRFQVRRVGTDERKRVVQTAARIVRIAFAQNPKLQNVDVVGVVLNDPERDNIKYAVFAEGMIPVFTASIERSKLIQDSATTIRTKKSPLTAPQIIKAPLPDDGTWLRALSRLYFNERVLPAKTLVVATPIFQTATPQIEKTPTPQNVPPKTVLPTPVSTPKIAPIIPKPTPIPVKKPATVGVVPKTVKPKAVKPNAVWRNKIVPTKSTVAPRRVQTPRAAVKAKSSTGYGRKPRVRRVRERRVWRPRIYRQRSNRRYRRER